MSYEDDRRLSPRFRDALVADRVELHGENLEQLTREITTDTETWTGHLARQLGFTLPPWRVVGLHGLMLQVIEELKYLINVFPLPDDGRHCNEIAECAVNELTPVEVYAILWAGPSNWRKDKDLPNTYADLDFSFDDALRRGLSSGLKGLFVRWNGWDIPRLHHRRKEAESRRRAEEIASRKPTTPEEIELQQRDRVERRKRKKFIPPPPGYQFPKTG